MSRLRYGSIIGTSSVILNTVLFIFKLWAGIISGSVALIADAWHTLSDSITSLVVVVGILYSSRPADEQHPFGHGRAESIASIIIATLLAIVGVKFGWESIQKLITRETPMFGTMALIVTVTTVVLKEVIAQVSIRVGKKHQIRSLVADGWHHRSDALSSILILVVILFNRYVWWLDGAAGILVSVIIFWVAFSIVLEASNSLLGSKPSDEFIAGIEKCIDENVEGALGVHHIHLHDYGMHRELTAHVCVPGNLNITEAHSIASNVETVLKEKLQLETTIHIEPNDYC
jgi:cation diffusion facilitator family transporter